MLEAARYWLLGMAATDPEYFTVLRALEFGLAHHNGKRNDDSPEFIHQLGIFLRLKTLHRHIRNPKMVYMLVFLHDIIEDQNQATKKFVAPEDIEREFGAAVRVKVLKLSKEILGQKNPEYSLDSIFEDEDCGVAKLGDRDDNISTMVGPFKRHRLVRYVNETRTEFLPRAKMARRRFPDQECVYENLKLSLIHQLRLVDLILSGYKPEE